MKKTISALMAAIMIVTLVYIPGFSAFAESEVLFSTGVHKNPFYAGEEIPDCGLEDYSLNNSVSKNYKGNTYYTMGKQLYNILATGLEKRNANITLYYISKTKFTNGNQPVNVIKEAFAAATDDSYNSSCTGGDYQRWAMDRWEADISGGYSDGTYYYYSMPISFKYYDTAAEEKKVDAVVNNFVSSLDTGSMTDYEIIKAVHDFICEKTVYCDEVVDDFDNYKYAYCAYGALVKGSCVCQGYSLAFYRICKELGYSARVLTSEYYNWSTLNYEGHAWNLVGLGDKYYYVDATWDDGDTVGYDYFLVNDKNIRADDSQKEHVPEDKYYDGDYYHETYGNNIDDKNYDKNNAYLLSNCVVSLAEDSFVYSGNANCPEVSVTSSGAIVDSGSYTVKYKANTNTGIAKAVVTGSGSYTGSSHRQFTVAPKKMSALSLNSGGRSATSITLKWSAAKGSVTGYKIEHYASGKWSVAATVIGASKTSATVKSLTPAASHKFRIRAYKMTSKRAIYGAYSNVYTTCTNPKAPALTLSTSKKAITASWKKVDASGYELQLSTASNFKSGLKKYTLGAKATSKKITSLKSGTKYYVRARAYKVINGKKYYSSWSSVKSLKCK